jgi:hypothetical protein
MNKELNTHDAVGVKLQLLSQPDQSSNEYYKVNYLRKK